MKLVFLLSIVSFFYLEPTLSHDQIFATVSKGLFHPNPKCQHRRNTFIGLAALGLTAIPAVPLLQKYDEAPYGFICNVVMLAAEVGFIGYSAYKWHAYKRQEESNPPLLGHLIPEHYQSYSGV